MQHKTVMREMSKNAKRIEDLRTKLVEAIEDRADLVAKARADGLQWDSIIEATGVSRQALIRTIEADEQ